MKKILNVGLACLILFVVLAITKNHFEKTIQFKKYYNPSVELTGVIGLYDRFFHVKPEDRLPYLREKIRKLEQSVQKNPNDAASYLKLANAMRSLSSEQTREKRKIRGKEQVVYSYVRNTEAEKTLDKAIGMAEKSSALEPCYQTYIFLGELYNGKYQFSGGMQGKLWKQKEIAMYKKALERPCCDEKDKAEAYEKLGNAYTYGPLKNLDLAIVYFKKAVTLKPESYFIYDSMGRSYEEKGDLKSAATYYEKAIARIPRKDSWDFSRAALGRVLSKLKRPYPQDLKDYQARLLRELQDKYVDKRRTAVMMLGMWEDPAVYEPLMKALEKEKDSEVQQAIVFNLSRLEKDKKIIGVLINLYKHTDTDEDLQNSILLALSKYDGESIKSLFIAQANKIVETQKFSTNLFSTVHYLSRQKDVSSQQALQKLANSKDKATGNMVKEVLRAQKMKKL